MFDYYFALKTIENIIYEILLPAPSQAALWNNWKRLLR